MALIIYLLDFLSFLLSISLKSNRSAVGILYHFMIFLDKILLVVTNID